MIDSHCHLDFPHFDEDRDEVLARAVGVGLTALVNPGTDLKSSQRADRPEIQPAGSGVD